METAVQETLRAAVRRQELPVRRYANRATAPAPATGEILIRNHAGAVNFLDTIIRRGEMSEGRLGTVRPYEYEDAATLLEDFWKEVDRVLRKRGSIP